MREQLTQYVNLLFAGASGCEEIRQEILQNTLDRYDDLIAQGKSPEAAYRLAISGIGDINEILSREPLPVQPVEHPLTEAEARDNRMKHAVSIAMYILCPIPLFLFSEFGLDTLGLCLTLILVAAATALRMTMRRDHEKEKQEAHREAEIADSPRKKVHKGIESVSWAICLAVYLLVSFATKAWYITWIIFPLSGAVEGLIKAIIDLKEENRHET